MLLWRMLQRLLMLLYQWGDEIELESYHLRDCTHPAHIQVLKGLGTFGPGAMHSLPENNRRASARRRRRQARLSWLI